MAGRNFEICDVSALIGDDEMSPNISPQLVMLGLSNFGPNNIHIGPLKCTTQNFLCMAQFGCGLTPPPPSHTNLQILQFFDTNSFVVSNGMEMATPNFVAMGGVSAQPVGDIRNPARVCDSCAQHICVDGAALCTVLGCRPNAVTPSHKCGMWI